MQGDADHMHIGFYTATILGWKQLLKPDKYKNVVLESLRFLVSDQRIRLYGFVIMPNHIHLLWRMLPKWQLESVQRDFMKYTSQMIKLDLQKHHPQVLEKFYVGLKDRQYQFWQRNSLTKVLTSRQMVEQKLTYIHNNPVQGKWLLATSPMEYAYSSVRFYEEGDKALDFLTHYLEDLG
jgi:putative transposase